MISPELVFRSLENVAMATDIYVLSAALIFVMLMISGVARRSNDRLCPAI